MFKAWIHLLVALATIILIFPQVHTEVINIKANQPSIDISLKQPNLDVSSYQVITLENGFRLLTITNPSLKGLTTFGLMTNVGSLENPAQTHDLNFMLSNYIAAGSGKYPNATQMNDFFAPQNVYWFVLNTRAESSSLATVPNELAEEAISHITESYLHPIFSEDGLQATIQSEIELIQSLQKGSAQFLFNEYFGSSPLNMGWNANAENILLNTSTEILNKTLVNQYSTFFSADNVVGCVVFEKYNQTIIDLITSQLNGLPNRHGKEKINKDYIPLRPFTDYSKLYMKLNSTTKQTLTLFIIPVGNDGTQQQNYEWIKLLLQLFNTRQGFTSQLQTHFKEIKSISSQMRYLNRKRYPQIQVEITLKNPSKDSGVNIYNYVSAYLKQDWNSTYAKYGLEIIRDLQYTFDKSPFAYRPNLYWDWLTSFNSYLQNMLQEGIQHTLDGEYFVDPSILKTQNSHSFKLVGIQFGEISEKDGNNGFTGLAYKYITPSSTLPKVNSARFTPNPYNLGVPATPQQFPKPSQDWMPYRSESITFAPSFFLNLPFSSATAILHYKASKNPAFSRVFFNALENYLQKDINYIYDNNIKLIENRHIFSFGLVGLKDNIFLLFDRLSKTISSDFCSQECFSAALESSRAYYSNFYNSSSITEILDDDQAHQENSLLSDGENSLKLLEEYDYGAFSAERKSFIRSISWEWLVITFKEQIADFNQAIIVLHAQNNISYFAAPSSSIKSSNCPTINTFSHSNLNTNAVRFYYNFGQNNLKNIFDAQRFEQLLLTTINDTSDNLNPGVHFTVDGNIGYKIDLSSATDNTSILSQKLQHIQKVFKRNYINLITQDKHYMPNVPIKQKLKRKEYVDISQQQADLIPYIHAQCYDCLTSWNQNQMNYWDSYFYHQIPKILEAKCRIAEQPK